MTQFIRIKNPTASLNMIVNVDTIDHVAQNGLSSTIRFKDGTEITVLDTIFDVVAAIGNIDTHSLTRV